jgi:hypothetical protein
MNRFQMILARIRCRFKRPEPRPREKRLDPGSDSGRGGEITDQSSDSQIQNSQTEWTEDDGLVGFRRPGGLSSLEYFTESAANEAVMASRLFGQM